MVGDVDAVQGDPAAVDLVEPHDQVDQRGLAGAGRPDDGDRLAGRGDQRQVVDQRGLRVVAEGHVLELHPPARGLHPRPGRPGPAICSSASRNSKTRSAEATPDCSTFAIDASWVNGWVNCREYWMNACTSPRLMLPGGDPQPADHRDRDVGEVPDEHHRRHDDAGDELRAEASDW